MSGRQFNSSSYKYGFGGKEKIDEINGGGNDYDFNNRIYDSRLGRWFSPDKMQKEACNWTPYRFCFDSPILFKDQDGNYETDGHYWTVLLVGILLKIPDAKDIAFYAELPDHYMKDDGTPLFATNTWLNPSLQLDLHALTGTDAVTERNRSRHQLLKAKTSFSKGMALHRLGDSYAHTNWNTGKTFPPYTGHSGESEGGTSPDKIYNRPGLYLEYTNDVINTLAKSAGVKNSVDMFAFNYITKAGHTSEANADILKSEVNIRTGTSSFEISNENSTEVLNFLTARKKEYGNFEFSIKKETTTRLLPNLWKKKETKTTVTITNKAK